MQKFNMKLSLLIFALLICEGVLFQFGEFAEAMQSINGKSLGSIDDVVKGNRRRRTLNP